MTTLEPAIDPVLAALADAILIPTSPGTTAPDWILQALERGLAGVTLFGPNVTGDLAALTASLRSASAVEPVIAIDEEAGDVTRVFYAGCPYPGNAALGAVDDVSVTRDVYAAVGAELARLGINTDLAPCADVLAPGGSHVVATRSFGPDPALVARHARAAHGRRGAAVLAVIAGVDLLCLGRDTDEAMYYAIRAALADAVESGRLAGARLEEAASRVAGLRARLAAFRKTATRDAAARP